MRLYTKLFTLAASTTLLAAAASADTFYSNSTSTAYDGYSATDSTPNPVATAATFNIPTGGVWSNPVGSSSWVSFNANTYPGGSYASYTNHAPNGYYSYSANFDATTGETGSITVMADDTVSVYLNGTMILDQYNGSSFPKCAAGTPNCITPTTVDLAGLVDGSNSLVFVVNQANKNATGLDYSGTLTTVTPEPSSLLLLGTGLVGSAGAMLRRFRRA